MPTPLTKVESGKLTALLHIAEEARENLIAVQAAAQIAESKFNRLYRELRIKHGAAEPLAWDPVAEKWRDPRRDQRAPVVDLVRSNEVASGK